MTFETSFKIGVAILSNKIIGTLPLPIILLNNEHRSHHSISHGMRYRKNHTYLSKDYFSSLSLIIDRRACALK